ncbi:MAG: ATPase, T2SS/T4P/T4SS family [Planctomycetaceae bacterium]
MPRGRSVTRAALAAAMMAGWAVPALAADAASGWPPLMPPSWGVRGTGGGLAIVPLVLWWLCVLAWMRTVEWVSTDATKHKLAPAFWGMVCGLPLFLAAILAWWIPTFLIGLPLMLVAWLAPVITYAVLRNAKVPPSEQVLTVGHARRLLSRLLAKVGIDFDPGIDEGDLVPVVALAAVGGKTADENAARLDVASKLAGFEEARKIMLGAVMARAGTLSLELDPAGTLVRHEVDGVWDKAKVRQAVRGGKVKEAWVDAPKASLEAGQAAVTALKALCGVAPNVRDAKAAPFLINVDGKPRNCRMSIRRQPSGEQLVVQIDPPAAVFKKLEDLGMPKPLADKVVELTRVEKGLIIISAPPASGLTTTFDVLVLSADRLLRDFISLEDAATPAREIQNVRPVPFDARTGVTPLQVLTDVLRSYPNVIVTRDVGDKQLVAELAKLAADDKLVILSVKATDATDAIARIASCGVPADMLARSLVASVSQRLVRKLCPKCREGYPPEPEPLPKALAQFKLTPEQRGRVRKASPHGCRLCGGTGYLGRTAVFELASGITLRKAIAAATDAATLRKAAVQDGMKPMGEAGLPLVLEGATSLDELQRVFAAKGSSAQQPPPPPGAKKS